jgi:flagellar protein FlgJ
MFLQMMMKTMRDAVPKSGLNESAAEETFQGMFDKEVSLAMAKRSTLGIADLLMKHMPDPNATPPSTAQMLQARQPQGMPLQAPPASAMPLQAAAPTLAPLPKAPGAMPLSGVYAASPSGLMVNNSQATDGAKP